MRYCVTGMAVQNRPEYSRTAAVILTGILMLMGCGGRQEDKTEAHAIYEEFVRENFAENPTRQILVDLDGDEKEEMILLADQTAADDPDIRGR